MLTYGKDKPWHPISHPYLCILMLSYTTKDLLSRTFLFFMGLFTTLAGLVP